MKPGSILFAMLIGLLGWIGLLSFACETWK